MKPETYINAVFFLVFLNLLGVLSEQTTWNVIGLAGALVFGFLLLVYGIRASWDWKSARKYGAIGIIAFGIGLLSQLTHWAAPVTWFFVSYILLITLSRRYIKPSA
ncbi:MAG: hypothetical protein KKA90_00325 [Nanoarchaeota archaeon]|nr:hypothetical protein [Nanoarchaeota archaeon]